MFRGVRIALMFFTRFPVGEIKNFETRELNESTRYFPWIGYIISFFLVCFLYISNQFLSYEVSLILMIGFSCLLTGCFHEDGFVDVCDGFGGGFSVEKKLEIMKDSRIGTYGAAGLWVLLSLKFFTLKDMAVETAFYAIICAAVISRLMATVLTKFGHYSRVDDLSKSKPLATKLSKISLVFAISSLLPLFIFPEYRKEVLISLITSLLLLVFIKWWGVKQIKGYTGDYLGFTQQLIEVFILLLWGSL